MLFDVLALDAAAGERRLRLEAADAAGATRLAAGEGLSVVSVRPARDRPAAAGTGLPWTHRARRLDLDLFCQELLAMVRSGITVREALQTLARKEGADARGSGVLPGLLRAVEEGLPLSQALARQPAVFVPLLVESIRAAERTSDYAPALERFVQYRRLGQQLRGKLAAAALYPALLLGVSLLVLLFLVGFVVPRFSVVYADMGDKLPAASRHLLAFGELLSAHPGAAAGLAGVLLVATVAAWRHGGARRLLAVLAHTVPRVGELLRTAELARLYRTTAMLLAGGISVVDALQLAAGALPAASAARLARARRLIQEGQGFAASLAAQGLATVVAERFFAVGEQTGRLAEMIDRAAEFHEEEVARAADWIARVIGPVMMLVMGVVIGSVVVLMYLPIFQLSEALG